MIISKQHDNYKMPNVNNNKLLNQQTYLGVTPMTAQSTLKQLPIKPPFISFVWQNIQACQLS